jgi:hypothetical protein
MINLIDHLKPKDKKYFTDNYLSKGLEVPFESNEDYAELLLGSQLPENCYPLVYKAFQNKINTNFNDSSKVFKNFKNDNKRIRRYPKLENLRKKYDTNIKKNSYHLKLKDLLSDNNSLNFKIMNDNYYIKRSFNKKVIFKNINKLIKYIFNIDLYFLDKHINDDVFTLYVKSEKNIKKIIINFKKPDEETNYLGCFQSYSDHPEIIGEIQVVLPIAVKNKHKLSFDLIVTFIHELGHALESELIKNEQYKKALNASGEALSLFFELLFLKNYSYITECKTDLVTLDFIDWLWSFDVITEIQYLKKLYNNNFNQKSKGEFSAYDFYTINRLKSNAVDCIEDIKYFPETIDQYLIGYLEAEKLFMNNDVIMSS